MERIMEYNEFIDELKLVIYKNSKANLIKKIASNSDRYVGVFRPTSPESKLIQNITQSHEISFGNFIEAIITKYLGKFCTNISKKATYKNKKLLYDQLFEYENKIIMVEQKMRDDHDSSNKEGQFGKILKKISYLKENYPDKEIVAIFWFVDKSLMKNKNYYLDEISKNKNLNVEIKLFYGEEFLKYIGKEEIWNEMIEYLIRWKKSEDNKIELDFEENWEETKKELLDNVPKTSWEKILSNEEVVNKILPVLFPTGKYKEILDKLNISYN